MLYFAYGSNMSSLRLAARVDELDCLGAARLADHALYCDKHGGDGSAKFTIALQTGSEVHGVLFQLPAAARGILDGFEGPGYAACQVGLQTGNGPATALSYQALDDWRDPSLLPFDWYVAYAVAGAVEHNLPSGWIRKLSNWSCQPDPVTERAELNRAILDGAQPDLELQRQWPC